MRITFRKVTHLCIHHSASPGGTLAEITKEHKARGWKDIAYHALAGNGKGIKDGEIHPGRPESQDGAGVYGNNKNKLHICLIGNFASDHSGYTGEPSRKQLHALGHWLLVKGAQYNVPYTGIVGHREIALKGHGTLCPGDLNLSEIRYWYKGNIWQAKQGMIVQSLAEYLLGPEKE